MIALPHRRLSKRRLKIQSMRDQSQKRRCTRKQRNPRNQSERSPRKTKSQSFFNPKIDKLVNENIYASFPKHFEIV
jgi:hypothetical protein